MTKKIYLETLKSVLGRSILHYSYLTILNVKKPHKKKNQSICLLNASGFYDICNLWKIIFNVTSDKCVRCEASFVRYSSIFYRSLPNVQSLIYHTKWRKGIIETFVSVLLHCICFYTVQVGLLCICWGSWWHSLDANKSTFSSPRIYWQESPFCLCLSIASTVIVICLDKRLWFADIQEMLVVGTSHFYHVRRSIHIVYLEMYWYRRFFFRDCENHKLDRDQF